MISRILCISSNDTFVEKHFVDKIFVETVGRDIFVDRHFVDRTFRRQDISSTNFCRHAFRRQNISSTEHFVDNIFRRPNILVKWISLIEAQDFRPHPHFVWSSLKIFAFTLTLCDVTLWLSPSPSPPTFKSWVVWNSKKFKTPDNSSTSTCVCRQSAVSTKRLSTKCYVDEVSCRRKNFDKMLVDEVLCRQNVVSTKIFRQ